MYDPGHAPPPPIPPGRSPSLGGYPARIARDGEAGLQFAVIPTPTYPTPTNTLQQRKDAISVSYTGRWEEAVDLYRQTVEEDGFFCGILDTIAHGILGLPVSFQGDPAMCSALLDADGTPGDFSRMHPEEEAAKIFRDGLGLGLGLGQYLLTCWRCEYTDHDRVQSIEVPGRVWEVCRRCDAARQERPAGLRELFQLQWRDPRWLWQNPVSFAWYYTGRTGMVPIVDGDGEWFMFRTVPGLESWRHGPWVWASLAAIFSRDSQYDAQNTSSVCAPTPVLRALKPTTPDARRAAEQRMEGLAFDNRFVLDGEWIYEIVSAAANYIDVCERIVNRCSDAFETGLTGNVMGRSARSAFTDANVYNRTTRERRAFYAGAWARQIREKGLRWYARENFGSRHSPVLAYDVRSPEDKLAASNALKSEGDALKALREGLDAMGLDADPAWVIERLQRLGIRVRPKPGNANAAKLPLGVDAVAAVVRGAAALNALGLQPFGDERDDMTIAELAAQASAGDAATPPPAAAPQAAPAPAAQGDDAPQPDDAAARLADKMTAHGVDTCEHGSRNRCRLCGIERVRDFEHTGDGPQWRIAWRAIARGAA